MTEFIDFNEQYPSQMEMKAAADVPRGLKDALIALDLQPQRGA